MNVLFFLTPKSEVAHLHDDWTLRQGIEKLERSGYTAIPMIDREGHYIGTVTEGGFSAHLKESIRLESAQCGGRVDSGGRAQSGFSSGVD